MILTIEKKRMLIVAIEYRKTLNTIELLTDSTNKELKNDIEISDKALIKLKETEGFLSYDESLIALMSLMDLYDQVEKDKVFLKEIPLEISNNQKKAIILELIEEYKKSFSDRGINIDDIIE